MFLIKFPIRQISNIFVTYFTFLRNFTQFSPLRSTFVNYENFFLLQDKSMIDMGLNSNGIIARNKSGDEWPYVSKAIDEQQIQKCTVESALLCQEEVFVLFKIRNLWNERWNWMWGGDRKAERLHILYANFHLCIEWWGVWELLRWRVVGYVNNCNIFCIIYAQYPSEDTSYVSIFFCTRSTLKIISCDLMMAIYFTSLKIDRN